MPPPGQAPSQSKPDGTGLAPPAQSEVLPEGQARTSPKSTHHAGYAGSSTCRTRRCSKPPPGETHAERIERTRARHRTAAKSPGCHSAKPGSRAPKRPRKDAGQHVSAHKRRPTERGGVLRTATTRSTRPPADAAQGQNVNIRRTTAASRGEGGAANSHRQTVNVGHPWAATRRRERRCRNSHREIRAKESTPPHSGRKPGLSVRLTWLLAPERPQRDARAKT